MNIFYTNSDPEICAYEHCNIHVVKMISEYTQILSTNTQYHSGIQEGLPKPTHTNHPSVIWARSNRNHYKYLHDLLTYLHDVYGMRGKEHKYKQLISVLKQPPVSLSSVGWEPPTLAVNRDDYPDIHKDFSRGLLDTVGAYKAYLNRKYVYWTTRTDKRKMFPKWALGRPGWVSL